MIIDMKQFFLILLLTGTALRLAAEVKNATLRERIYVQTDKQLYLAGEQVRMKLMTLDTEQRPLVFSKVAYAELVSDSLAKIQIKVALTNGAGEGRMSLPVDLPTGFYRLIAYTQYMRNEGEQVFFEKNIGVINTFQSGYYPVTAPSEGSINETITPTANVKMQPDKTIYSTCEQGELVITGLPANIHTLSVSIAGKEMIENLTFAQKRLPTETAVLKNDYLPEYEGHIITGTIIDNQTGKAALDNTFVTPVLSFPGEGIRIFTGQKNKSGVVRFYTSAN